MEKYLKLAISFTKIQYLPHVALTFLFCILSGGFMSFRNLESYQVARVMEMYVTLAGILLLTPIFMPEQDVEIWSLEKSKATSMWKIYLNRLIEAVLLLMVINSVFVYVLYVNHCFFEIGTIWIGSFCEMFFLGSIGFFVSAITNQVVIGYMISVIYFAVNVGANKYFWNFALFQMMKGQYDFWEWMLAGSIVLCVGGILVREHIE